jgi:uncharacterized protein DUF5999
VRLCPHRPPCPPADRRDRDAARTVVFHPEQGWSLLCNGVIVFDDRGAILPGGRVVPPHRPARVRLPAVAQKRQNRRRKPTIRCRFASEPVPAHTA